MKRFMQDLGDLAGLDIVAAGRCAPVRDAGTRSDAIPAGAALARGALRWLGVAAADDGRCRAAGPSDADRLREPASRLH